MNTLIHSLFDLTFESHSLAVRWFGAGNTREYQATSLFVMQLPRRFPNLNVLTLRVSISPKDEYLTATHMHPAHVVKPQNGARTLRRPSPTARL